MSSTSSRAAIRFVIALFLAQTFVNAVAVPHPHIHRVVDARQVVSLPLIEREQPPVNEPKNVFDAIVDTLKGYNGWQVFTDFFRKLFNGAPSSNGSNPWPSVVVIPSPGASATPIDVVSAIESFISEIASTPASVVVVPTDASGSSATESVAVAPTDASESSATESVAVAPTDASESSATDSAEPSATDDPIMSILPIFPITTAIELFPTEEPTIPSELLSEILPEATETSVTQVVIELPTGVLTIPLVTAPVGTGPVEITPSATDAPFPVSNGTLPTILPGTDVPVIIIIPTGIPGPVNGTIEASGSATLEANVTVSLTSTVGLTVTIDPTLIGTDVASVGTGLPVTFTDEPLFPNVTAITPTLILVTGTGASVGTVIPTIGVDPISPLYPNSTTDIATAVAPIGTSVVIIGTGIIGTAVTSIEPVETITLGTGIIGTGTGAAVAPIDTALPLFPNTTAIEIVVEPTFVLGTGTAPVVGTASAAPVSSATDGAIWANTTTTTVTNIVTPSVVGTGIPGTIVVVPGPENTNVLFPNVTITVNATAEATLVLPVATELPVEVVTSVEPIIEPIPTDLPVVEFPGQPIPPIFPTEESTILPVIPIIPALPTPPVAPFTPVYSAPTEVTPVYSVPVEPVYSVPEAPVAPVAPFPVGPAIQPPFFPDVQPSILPAFEPSVLPDVQPSILPAFEPTVLPDVQPSILPAFEPTVLPDVQPSILPAFNSLVLPDLQPSILPAFDPPVLRPIYPGPPALPQ